MFRKLTLAVLSLFILIYVLARLIPVDPQEQRPGLRLSGDLAINEPANWEFLTPGTLIYVQTDTWYGIPHSVTTTSFVHAGQLYVPCRECAGKRWSNLVARNNLVLVKVQGTLYPRQAVRITDPETRAAVFGRSDIPDSLYLFRMDLFRKDLFPLDQSDSAT